MINTNMIRGWMEFFLNLEKFIVNAVNDYHLGAKLV